MELFIRVFVSVLTALTSFALLLSGLFSLIVWYDDGELADLLPALGVAGMIWVFGLVLFGFSGPFFWCVFYFLLQRLKLRPLNNRMASVVHLQLLEVVSWVQIIGRCAHIRVIHH